MRTTLYYRRLKLLQIYFAYRLFVSPYAYTVAARFLVVQRKMLEVYEHTLGLYSLNFIGTYIAAYEGVFRIIFKIPAAVGSTLDVSAGAVEA